MKKIIKFLLSVSATVRQLAAVTRHLVVLIAILAMVGAAQAATYAYRNDIFSYDTPSASAQSVNWHTGTTGSTNGAPACTTYPLGDDDWADVSFASATTPANDFTFTFANTVYNSMRIYSNGMLVFGTDTSGQWRTFSNATLPYTTTQGTYATGCSGGQLQRAIIPYWTDIVAGTGNSTSGASIKYELLGTAPNRRLVISWVNVKLYNQTARYNFQVILYESPGAGLNSSFKFQYTTGSSTGSAATVGVQVSTTDSTLYSFNQSFIDPVAGSAILWYPSNQLAGKAAEYRFDEATWTGAAGEVKDTSGQALNASRLGLATSVANGAVCRGGSIPLNTLNTRLDAIATPIQPTSVGSIDFWFNSNVRWNSTDAMLFDATTTAARPFFLMKTSAGALKFVVTDSAGTVLTLTSANRTFALNTWHHIGVSWNLRPGTNQTLLQIFLDGVLINTLRTTSSGTIAAGLSTLDLGDNATSGVTPSGGSPNSANGILDEVNIYPTEINANQALQDMGSTHACQALDHFHLIHGGTGVNCVASQVTIEAHDSSHALASLSGVTMTLSTSPAHGTWSNVAGGSINLINNQGNGVATYVFSNEARVVFGLQNPTSVAESLAISVVSGTSTTTSGAAATCVAADYTYGSVCNAPLSFALTGFIVSSTADGVVATVPSQRAGVSSGNYYLRAVQTNTTTKACEAALTGTKSVEFAYECASNPSTCASSNLMSVTGSSATQTITRNNSGSVTSYQALNLNFDANGNAPFSFAYGDVGQVVLRARKQAGSSDAPTLLTTLTGSTNSFVVKPYDFGIDTITCASPSVTNPAATNASGAKFCPAGSPFSLKVSARTSGGATTPSFGRCSSASNDTTCAAASETVTLSHALVAPVSGVNGTLGVTSTGALNANASAFVGGTGSYTFNNLNWSEVGIINLKAANANYLSNNLAACSASPAPGDNCQGTYGASGNVGRFYPHHFDVSLALPTGCSGFIYGGHTETTATLLGQPFTVTVTARNGLVTPTTTENYRDSLGFAKNVDLTLAAGGTVGKLYVDSVQGGSNAIPASKFTVAGVGTVNFSDATGKISYVFDAAAPTGSALIPTTMTVHADNVDSATSVGTDATLQARFGRLRMSNAFGSEKLILQMPVQAEYWSASSWVINSADSCTSLGASNFYLTPSTLTTVSGTTTLSGGSGKINLTAPANGATGFVDIAANLGSSGSDQSCLTTHGGSAAGQPWLRSRNGGCAGTYDRDPSARASFGIYTPEGKRLIHVREFY